MKNGPLGTYLEAHGLSQGAFARRLGVKSGVVCRWVSGQRVPTVHYALAIERETGGAVPVSAWEEKPAPRKGRRPAPRRAAARDVFRNT